MKLFSRKYNTSKSQELIIIHGLFGMSDNWNSLGKKFSQHFSVHLIDLRNHGRSPHSEVFNYDVMSEDILQYIYDNNIHSPVIIGHSLGGKVAMNFAFKYASKVKKLVIVDIAPKIYGVDFHKNILLNLSKINLNLYDKRDHVNNALSLTIKESSIRLFLMKNIYRNKNNSFAWRFNISGLLNQIDNISSANFLTSKCNTPTCFVKGQNSNYITINEINLINEYFTNCNFINISDAGHWVHAEQPEKFYNQVIDFIS